MVNRTNTNSTTDLAAQTCVVEVIVPLPHDIKFIELRVTLDFFTSEIMVKAIRFMPDIPPNLMEFVDKLRELNSIKQKV